MSGAGIALLVAIGIVTLVYVPVAATIRPLSGPDAMELAAPLLLSMGRWILLAILLLTAAARGGFPWIHRMAAVQAIAVFALLAGVGVLEVWSVASATSYWYGTSARVWVAAFCVVAPLILAYLGAIAWQRGGRVTPLASEGAPSGAASLRLAALTLVLLMACGAAALAWKNQQGAREKREALAQRAAEETRVRDEGIAAFRGLDPNAPLRDWLPYTSDSIEEIREGAVAAIRSRPRLDEDLAEILRSAEPLPALRYISQWYRNPPASLAGPVSDAISSLPDWVRRRLDDSDDSNNYEIGNACDACLAIVDDFHDPRLDFRPGIERLVAYLDSRALPPERISYDSTHLARSTLHAWLDAHRGAGAKNAADDAARPAGRATDRQ